MAALLITTAISSPQAAAAAPAKLVTWGPCAGLPPEQQAGFSCAVQEVPLDYSDPGQGTVGLAMMRRPAADQSRRVGSLFLNPGGPGGSGLSLPLYADTLLQPEVLQRFDLIGFDPRGVGASRPLRCFTTDEEFREVAGRVVRVPITQPQIDATLKARRDYTDACARNAGPLLEHMSTQDVARDLDVLREGVGERQLNFLGFSYGSLLGATYANLFPDRARALVLDGQIDPRLWTTDGVEYERQRAQGFELSLDAFLKRCASVGAACPFSQGDPRAKFDEIRTHIRTSPVTLPVLGEIEPSDFTLDVSTSLYSPLSFRELASFLQKVYDVVHPEQASSPVSAGQARLATPYLFDDSHYGVSCVDKPFPQTPSRFPDLATQWEQESPTFGRYLAFDSLPCASWPTRNPHRFDGPWNRNTPNPVLLFGNYYDPATNYTFAKRMADELGNARLVSVDAFGHTILGSSKCAGDIATRYLVDLTVPAKGLLCQPDKQPFE